MSWIEQQTDSLKKAAVRWLQGENATLEKAVEKTVAEGLFSREDVDHQIQVLRKNIEEGQVQEWVQRSGLTGSSHAKGKKVLCLHAGNLPLVGFQTALGTILSGAEYYGKLSRKDPHLLASFLEEVKKAELGQEINYSTDLDDFENLQADKVVFAGSESSVPNVKQEVNRLKAASPVAEYIIRTARFSITYLDDKKPETLKQLMEAVLRYGGRGCRSVAVVVAPFSLEAVAGRLKEKAKAFWKDNPQHLKPGPVLKYQYAYNEAVRRSQLWLEDFLVQETEEQPELDFTLNWVECDKEKVQELKEKFGGKLQSVYTTGEEIEGIETEFLEQAQCPPLWWKPDGVDVVNAIKQH